VATASKRIQLAVAEILGEMTIVSQIVQSCCGKATFSHLITVTSLGVINIGHSRIHVCGQAQRSSTIAVRQVSQCTMISGG
jgi:hypothetical protein